MFSFTLHAAPSWLLIGYLSVAGDRTAPEGQTKYIWPKKWRKLAHRQMVPTLGNSKYQLFHMYVPGLLFSIYSNIASQARPLASCWRVWYVLSINVAQNYSNLTVTADEQWTFPIACQQTQDYLVYTPTALNKTIKILLKILFWNCVSVQMVSH